MQTPIAQGFRRLQVARSLPFFLVHLAALGVFFFPFRWSLVALCVGSYALRMFAITAGYHRYFSHRSYRLGRLATFAIGALGCMCVQKGPLWWAANHRVHHKNSDLENDVHSPVQHGFWWSHVGWILSDVHDETEWAQIPDLAKFGELRWLNKYHLLLAVLYASAIYAGFGGAGLVWGFFLSTVLLWHGTFTINSLSHVYGSRRYATADTSRNNFWLALVTLGEGWHNNHHCYMSAAKQGFFWWEIDLSYYALKAFSVAGIVRDLRQPPLALLEAKRLPAAPRARVADNALVHAQLSNSYVTRFRRGKSHAMQISVTNQLANP